MHSKFNIQHSEQLFNLLPMIDFNSYFFYWPHLHFPLQIRIAANPPTSQILSISWRRKGCLLCIRWCGGGGANLPSTVHIMKAPSSLLSTFRKKVVGLSWHYKCGMLNLEFAWTFNIHIHQLLPACRAKQTEEPPLSVYMAVGLPPLQLRRVWHHPPSLGYSCYLLRWTGGDIWNEASPPPFYLRPLSHGHLSKAAPAISQDLGFGGDAVWIHLRPNYSKVQRGTQLHPIGLPTVISQFLVLLELRLVPRADMPGPGLSDVPFFALIPSAWMSIKDRMVGGSLLCP